jgi:hypothetical protein
MGRKKQIEGSIVSIDIPAPEKKKKELSEKQRENLTKGMAILKAKREAKAKKSEVEDTIETPPIVTPPVVAPPVVTPPVVAPPPEKKERKPRSAESTGSDLPRKSRVVKNYLTTEDFNSFKNELLGSLKTENTPPPPIQNVQPQVIKEIVKERVITGRELLDKIFFK